MKQAARIGLVLGSVLFLVAVLFPVTTKVFGEAENDPNLQVQLIEENRTSWQISSILLGAGATIAVVGLALFTSQLQTTIDDQNLKILCYVSAVLAAVGVVFWIIITINRAIMEPSELRGNMDINDWMYPVYAVLTNTALLIIGFVLLRTGFPKWLIGIFLVIGAFQLAMQLITGDSVPLFSFPPFFLLGLLLIRRASIKEITNGTTMSPQKLPT